jgi:hypothetical protein
VCDLRKRQLAGCQQLEAEVYPAEAEKGSRRFTAGPGQNALEVAS